MAHREPKNIVIIGGGIIGATSAYFCAHHPSFDPATTTITLLEATQVAGGASGKAGGLLALWAYPKCLVPLSYRLHKELADKHDGANRWGYRAVQAGELVARGRPNTSGPTVNGRRDRPNDDRDGDALGEDDDDDDGDPAARVGLGKRSGEAALAAKLRAAAGLPADLDWIAPECALAYSCMGDASTTTAQVHPYLFTTAMAALARERGARLVHGAAASIERRRRHPDGSGAVRAVAYVDRDTGERRELPADAVVLCAGPWTRRVWAAAPIGAVRAHSVTVRPARRVSAHALFTEITLPVGDDDGDTKKGKRRKKSGATHTVTPEIYARPDGEVYACGEGDRLVALPAGTDAVEVDSRRCQDIVDQVGAVSDELRDGVVTARQACYLPDVTATGAEGEGEGGGGPLVGESGVEGLYIAAGHTCWGIQNGPGTGKVVSEFVFEGGARSADVASLDPRKYM